MLIKYLGKDLRRFTDNELQLVDTLVAIVDFSDPYCNLFLIKEENRIIGHITCSNVEWRSEMIQNLLYLNRVMKIKVIFSKSLGISGKVSFQIDTQ